MTGISIETTLELWALSLRAIKARMAPLFPQERVAASAGLFLDGLLGDERRKTGWMRAEAAGDPGPWRQQAILGRGRWDADALRDIVREYALETLADQDAVLVLDETGFLKQGKASCGVARQYTGSAGKITNCQIGVFCAYLIDKFGPKVMVCGSGALVAIAWVINSMADSLIMLYVGAAIGGVGAGIIYGASVGNALKWFPDRRGLAAGLTAAGFGAGSAATVIPIANMIASSGYQAAFLWFGLGQGIIVMVVALLLKAPQAGEVSAPLRRRRHHSLTFPDGRYQAWSFSAPCRLQPGLRNLRSGQTIWQGAPSTQ